MWSGIAVCAAMNIVKNYEIKYDVDEDFDGDHQKKDDDYDGMMMMLLDDDDDYDDDDGDDDDD